MTALFSTRRRKHRHCAHLGIVGLPERVATLRAVGAYLVYADPSDVRDALVFGVARTSSAECVVLALARDPEQAAAAVRARQTGASPGRRWPASLNVLAAPPAVAAARPAGSASPLARLAGGLASLLEFGVPPGSLVIVEGADGWFDWDDGAAMNPQMDYVVDWSRAWRCCVVFVLGPHGRGAAASQADDDFHGAVRGGRVPERRFDGVACLLRTGGDVSWWTQFWNDAPEMETEWPLERGKDGAMRVLAVSADQTAQRLARRAGRLLAARAAVQSEAQLPPNYEVFEDNDALAAACHPGGNAVALFAYAGQEDFEGLCRAVCDVRRRCGRKIGIVVRECHWTLRHEHELLLRNLGINMVAGREVSFSRLQILISLVREQRFTGPIASDYHATLAAATAEESCGYLSMARFCEHVARVLERGRALPLPHVIVQLRLRAQAGHLSALRACRLSRHGDVCTADADSLYLFLFSCPEADVDRVLQRVFAQPLSAFFDEVTHLRNIGEHVSQLMASECRQPAADYSDVLAHTASTANFPPRTGKSADVLMMRAPEPAAASASVRCEGAQPGVPPAAAPAPSRAGARGAVPVTMPLRITLRHTS